MRSGVFAALVAATAAGCFNTQTGDCTVTCSPTGGCPQGLHCVNGFCAGEGETCSPAPESGIDAGQGGGSDGAPAGQPDAASGLACGEGAACDDGDACTDGDVCAGGVCAGTVCGCHAAACCGDHCQNGLSCRQGSCRMCSTSAPAGSGSAAMAPCHIYSVTGAGDRIDVGAHVWDGNACLADTASMGALTLAGVTASGAATFGQCPLTRISANGAEIHLHARTFDGESCTFSPEEIRGTLTLSGATVSGSADLSLCRLTRVSASGNQIQFWSLFYDAGRCTPPETVAGTLTLSGVETCL